MIKMLLSWILQIKFNVMRRDGLFSDGNEKVSHEYYTTGDPTSFDHLARTFMDDATLTSKHVDTENE